MCSIHCLNLSHETSKEHRDITLLHREHETTVHMYSRTCKCVSVCVCVCVSQREEKTEKMN